MKSYDETPFQMFEEFESAIEELFDEIKGLKQKDFDEVLNFVKRNYNKKDIRLRYKAVKY